MIVDTHAIGATACAFAWTTRRRVTVRKNE
jgi:hypothetical protein